VGDSGGCLPSQDELQTRLHDACIASVADDTERAALLDPVDEIRISVIDFTARIGELRVIERLKASKRNSKVLDSVIFVVFSNAMSKLFNPGWKNL